MEPRPSTYDLVVEALPLVITGLAVTDPILTLFGDGWSLNLMCPWSVAGGGIATSWWSARLEDEAWELIGRSIVGVTSGPDVIDPTLHLSGGAELRIWADTDLDPWALALPSIVVVGRMPPVESDDILGWPRG